MGHTCKADGQRLGDQPAEEGVLIGGWAGAGGGPGPMATAQSGLAAGSTGARGDPAPCQKPWSGCRSGDRQPGRLPQELRYLDRILKSAHVPAALLGGSEQQELGDPAGPPLLAATARAASEPAGCLLSAQHHRGDGQLLLVLYGRRPRRHWPWRPVSSGLLGLPIYLHEGTMTPKHGSDASAGPAGLVIEVGPCGPSGVDHRHDLSQTQLAVRSGPGRCWRDARPGG